MQSCLGPKMPISRLATESRPSQAQCSSWQLPLNGRAVPALPCAGKLPSHRPPVLYHRACAIPACRRRASHVDAPSACAAPAVRITNHESRITPVLYHRACAIPARRRRASHVDAPLPARFQLAADAPVMSTRPCVARSRSSNHESRVTNHGSYGRSGPPLCGGTPPATPPCVIPPCLRDSSSPPTRQSCRRPPACAIQLAADAPVMSTPPCVRGSRSSNHESRVTNHACVIPPCLRDSSSPPTRQSCRRPPACAAPAVRITNHESRITLCYTTVPARFQLAADAPVMSTPPCVRGSRSSNHESRVTNHACVIPPCLRDSSSPPTRQSCRRHHACAAPAVRITNHESRITPVLYHRVCAIPARRRRASHVDATMRARLPQFESRITSHEITPVLYHRACAIPARRRRASHVDAPLRARLPQFESRITSHESRLCYTTVSARFQLAADAPVMSTPPCVRGSRSSNHESRVTNHALCYTTVPARFQLAADAPVMSTPPCVRGSRSSNHESRVTNHACVIPPCLRVPSLSPARRGREATVRARRLPVPSSTPAHRSHPVPTTGH